MSTPRTRNITTIARAAKILAVDEDMLHDIHMTMEACDGAIWIYDEAGDGTAGFTEIGMENLEEELADRRSQPFGYDKQS